MSEPRIEPRKEVTRSYVQSLNGSAEEVFPLLCPVRELEWVPDWPLISVRSDSGVAEKGCLFVTGTDSGEAVWVITEHDPAAFCVEMLRIDPAKTVCSLEIQLQSETENTCKATASYSHSALTSEGEELVEEFTEEFYKDFMLKWETVLNRFLDNQRIGANA